MAVAVDVHTVVHPADLAGDRVGARAVITADVVAAGDRPHQRAAGAGIGDDGLAAAVVNGDRALARADAVGGEIRGIELGDLGVDGVGSGKLRGDDRLVFRFILLELFLQLCHQLLSLADARCKLFLLVLQLGHGGVVDCLLGLILCLDALMLLARSDIALLERTVAGHDVADVVDRCEEAAEAVCLEQQREDADVAVLLHRADAGAIALELLVLEPLCLVHLALFFLDERLVALDLLVGDGDLLADIGVSLVIGGLLLDQRGLLFLQLGDLRLALLGLGGKLFLARLQLRQTPCGVDRVVLVGIDTGRQHADHKAEKHQHREKHGDGRHDFFPVHCISLRVW